MKSTGNYLTAAEFLPKGILQFKQLANANKESKSEVWTECYAFLHSAHCYLFNISMLRLLLSKAEELKDF